MSACISYAVSVSVYVTFLFMDSDNNPIQPPFHEAENFFGWVFPDHNVLFSFLRQRDGADQKSIRSRSQWLPAQLL